MTLSANSEQELYFLECEDKVNNLLSKEIAVQVPNVQRKVQSFVSRFGWNIYKVDVVELFHKPEKKIELYRNNHLLNLYENESFLIIANHSIRSNEYNRKAITQMYYDFHGTCSHTNKR